MLGTTELVWLGAVVRKSDGTVRPRKLSVGRRIFRHELRRRHRKNSTVAFNHNLSDVGSGLSYESDATARVFKRFLSDPFSSTSSLSETTAGH
jgi:hypothetical protein